LRPPGTAAGKGDRIADEKRARRRAELADSTLGRGCLSACERLFDWSNDRSDARGLAAAAETLIVAVQHELTQRESPLEPSVGIELGYVRAWAVFALCDVSTASQAKRTELRLTDGAPLTICTGFTHLASAPFLGTIVEVPAIVHGEARVLHVPAFGCFAIFPDTTRTSAKPWKHWCDRCEPSRSKVTRKTVRAHRRVVSAINAA
jgi:hypothetical protein